MSTIDTIANRPTSGMAAGDAYFETSSDKIVVWTGTAWTEIASDNAPASFTNTYSVNFDGTNDYVELSAAPSTDFNFGTGEFGLSMWVNAINGFNGTYCGVLGNYNSAASSWQVFVGTAGLQVWNGALYGGGSLSTNTWYHLVVERTSGVLKTYINGSQNTSNNVTSSYAAATNSSTCIGGYPANRAQPRWKGLIDEVAIFNSGLSASDVTDMYNSGVPTDISSLNPIGWWRMGDNDGGTGSTITDQGSAGNNGTLTNGPTFSTDVPS